MLSFDVSPLRPWEWANLSGDDARWWHEAVAYHNAYREGIQSAHAEKAGWDRLATMEAGEVG